ncbi:hypothetical protein AX774_g5791 [Zancudomyces culisetae]|uniref:Hexosyltransferase n=1 Tax=Zancudomyces culisetae TaxID=1213189 RepID=A0A1R1PIM0_ZANCU|nr:hypothetical protein AX774_g5791 [Zancudomyces culisetae]|eukprot:OMH80769.1 hypothetical protein AX774_g5791 [Zancudomyces culisetae]
MRQISINAKRLRTLLISLLLVVSITLVYLLSQRSLCTGNFGEGGTGFLNQEVTKDGMDYALKDILDSNEHENDDTLRYRGNDITNIVKIGKSGKYEGFKYIKLADISEEASITNLVTFDDKNSDYAIIIPISPADDIFWIKNLYYGFNVLTVCDKDDPRAQKKHLCDIVLDDNYEYRTLAKKTNDMISKICKTLPRYKTIVKLDFDVVINKKYLVELLNLMIPNGGKRLYFGDPNYKGTNKVAMNGKVYAFTRRLLEDFCNCTEVPKTRYGMSEDNWFGDTLARCALQKNEKFNYNDEYILIISDRYQIHHKEYTKGNVNYKVGRFAYKTDK